MNSIGLKSRAKINLSIDVLGKRQDGYHIVEMIMQTIDLYDSLDIKPIREDKIIIKCNKPYVPTDERNLAYKAAKLFKETYNINKGVFINIEKNIPMSAGLAGGSTDAAAVLKGMNKIFDMNIDEHKLMELGVKIGADVPYCIKGGTALCEGIGEVITPLKSFKDNIVVLVKPPFGVSTKEVYGDLDLNKVFKHVEVEKIIDYIDKDDLKGVCENMKNILENVTLRNYPTIRGIKKNMWINGSVGVMMSGSGPTVFAFFEDMVKAQRCYDNMKKKYKDVFITRTI